MSGPAGTIALESGKKAGIPPQLRGYAVVGVSSDGEGENDNLGGKMADLLDDELPRLLRIVQVGIGKPCVSPLSHPEDPSGLLRLLLSEAGAPSSAGFACRQIQDTNSIAVVDRFEEGTRAGELNVVTVGGDGENVDGHW
jgi:hypothetical protein